jgi:hypothetical protein
MKWLFSFFLLAGFRLHAGISADSSLRSRFVSGGFAAVAYKGSLQSGYQRWTPAYQAGLLLEKKKFISSYIGIGFGTYIGEDRSYRLPAKADPALQPSKTIEAGFFTLHYEARFLLFRYRNLRIQACQGIGLFRFSVRDREGNLLSDKPRTRASGESYSQNSFFFPGSLMLQYRFPNEMGIGFQMGWFNTTSPYLDNMDQLAQNKTRDNLASFRFHILLPLTRH